MNSVFLARWEARMYKLVESLNAERSALLVSEEAYITAKRLEKALMDDHSLHSLPQERRLPDALPLPSPSADTY